MEDTGWSGVILMRTTSRLYGDFSCVYIVFSRDQNRILYDSSYSSFLQSWTLMGGSIACIQSRLSARLTMEGGHKKYTNRLRMVYLSNWLHNMLHWQYKYVLLCAPLHSMNCTHCNSWSTHQQGFDPVAAVTCVRTVGGRVRPGWVNRDTDEWWGAPSSSELLRHLLELLKPPPSYTKHNSQANHLQPQNWG